jgi:hypothetical protein
MERKTRMNIRVNFLRVNFICVNVLKGEGYTNSIPRQRLKKFVKKAERSTVHSPRSTEESFGRTLPFFAFGRKLRLSSRLFTRSFLLSYGFILLEE